MTITGFCVGGVVERKKIGMGLSGADSTVVLGGVGVLGVAGNGTDEGVDTRRGVGPGI